MKTLHILNGSSTYEVFKQTKIVGDVLIWNEILAEGPVAKNNLWKLRAEWIFEHFNESPSNYATKVIDEIEKLKNLESYDEVILWFEFDLVCQINLIYILSVLDETLKSTLPIYLICPEKIEGIPNFRGLGQLNPQQLSQLYDTKVRLQKTDLSFATRAWELYIENNQDQIHAYLNNDFGKLGLLRKALIAHLSRFPKKNNGLNHIEETLLELIDKGFTKRPELYEAFWTREPIYGITDLQLDFVLNKLKEEGLTTV
jgi:hypothetical protein